MAASLPATGSFDGLPLSPLWNTNIQRSSAYIAALARAYGFHPDFIAAIIEQEQDDAHRPIGRLGTLSLMSLTAGDDRGWRPSSETLLAPSANLHWGMAILSHVVQQSGGDLTTALAAYSGGWEVAGGRAPHEYAARVLDRYARALLVRAGLSPEMADRWTVAVEIRAGNVPAEGLVVLGGKPVTTLHTFAPHIVYAYTSSLGQDYYIRGYVVPVGLSEVVAVESGSAGGDQLEAPLRARLGEKSARGASGNPRVLLICLPSMSRLRGQVRTRWYAPSGCPAAER